jgi:hypothetical protein
LSALFFARLGARPFVINKLSASFLLDILSLLGVPEKARNLNLEGTEIMASNTVLFSAPAVPSAVHFLHEAIAEK